MALVGRVLGGLLNGNIAVIQTMVGELVKNPKHERLLQYPICRLNVLTLITARAFAVMPFGKIS